MTGVEVAGQRADQVDERFWITYWHPHRASAGDIVGVNVAAEEITERKRAQAALQASERQFHTLADSIPQLVWMADAQGAIYWLNNHWYEYTGKPAGEVNPHGWQSIFGPSLDRSAGQPEWRWRRSFRCSERTDSIVRS